MVMNKNYLCLKKKGKNYIFNSLNKNLIFSNVAELQKYIYKMYGVRI